MTVLAQLQRFGVSYSRDRAVAPALADVDLDLKAGEKLAIIGESGSGKSTIALALAGLLPSEAKLTGSLVWPGYPDRPPRAGRDIGFVFQDPGGSLNPVFTIGNTIAEVVQVNRSVDWHAALQAAHELIDRVRLPDPELIARSYPHQLSGGQRQRVAIAAAIAGRPLLLIADEATSALDTIVQAEIVALIRSLVEADGMTLLFISHDIALAASLADRIAVLRSGRLVECGDTRTIIQEPKDAYTKQLLRAHLAVEA
ncbi:ABC transporter ATP-binding protein [Tianweitania sp. BSSL-BM11]|uniref:ABC transporter ATP-binding protein n=1 Tax=Tianweitania aestuarii TaxID=2814886 RepID=A0ABS5RT77_9HYPH|nr:ABC transporter ATP-binding protein [Tianweitania aestuarii]MBS9720258.1 ABC transporter ATP-binding protein [Tianweitania aestuarii]